MIFLQETHMAEDKMQEAMQYFIIRGWKAIGVPATATGRGGTTGGFLCLLHIIMSTVFNTSAKKAMDGWQWDTKDKVSTWPLSNCT